MFSELCSELEGMCNSVRNREVDRFVLWRIRMGIGRQEKHEYNGKKSFRVSILYKKKFVGRDFKIAVQERIHKSALEW